MTRICDCPKHEFFLKEHDCDCDCDHSQDEKFVDILALSMQTQDVVDILGTRCKVLHINYNGELISFEATPLDPSKRQPSTIMVTVHEMETIRVTREHMLD